MNMRDRAKLGGAAMARRAAARRESFAPIMAEEATGNRGAHTGLKKAAYRAGIPVRTAMRYQRRLQAEGRL